MTDKEIRLPEGLDVETATDVLREFAHTDDAQIVSESHLDSLEDSNQEAKEAFAALLAEESPQSAETLARQDMDALTEPFRDDDGDIDVDTLRQEPETQEPDGGGDPGDPGGDDVPADLDSLSRDEANEIRRLCRKRDSFENREMPKRVDALESEIAAELNADSYDDIKTDLEAL